MNEKDEAKLLLLGNTCSNCDHLYIPYKFKFLCGKYNPETELNKKISLSDTCENWIKQWN